MFAHEVYELVWSHPLFLRGVETEIVDDLEKPGAGKNILGHRLQDLKQVRGRGGSDVALRDLLLFDEDGGVRPIFGRQDVREQNGRHGDETKRGQNPPPAALRHLPYVG